MPTGSRIDSVLKCAWKPNSSSSAAACATPKSKYLKNPSTPRLKTIEIVRICFLRRGSPVVTSSRPTQ